MPSNSNSHPLASADDQTTLVDPVWADAIPFHDPANSKRTISRIVGLVDDEAWTSRFRHQLTELLVSMPRPDQLVDSLFRFLRSTEDPIAALEVFDAHEAAASSLLKLFAINEALANRLVASPDAFLSLYHSDKSVRPYKTSMADRISQRLTNVENPKRAGQTLRSFYSQELIRIAHEEIVLAITPDRVGKSLSQLYDVIVQAALRFTKQRLAEQRGEPVRPDGAHPEVTVIGLGNLGGQEIAYGSPLQLIFLFDTIDYRNTWHRNFYERMVRNFVDLMSDEVNRDDFIDIDLRSGPKSEVGVHICSIREAARIYETSGRPWQRLQFVKARVVAGSQTVGRQFLDRLKPWIYRRYAGNAEHIEIQAIRNKLLKRSHDKDLQKVLIDRQTIDISRLAGGRRDLEFLIQFLQILHGPYLPAVRQTNFLEAVISLRHENCLAENDAKMVSDHYARLARLENLLALGATGHRSLPENDSDRSLVAWNLGIRSEDQLTGDFERFSQLLESTYTQNRELIDRVMNDVRFERMDRDEPDIESELVLDPNPDSEDVESTMRQHGIANPQQAMDHLAALCRETVPFLSPHRCRHTFALLAPKLLRAVAKTPNPDRTLGTLVEVTDSLGAKALLWDLLQSHEPTMELLIKLCAAAPYLSRILVEQPGMVDELLDSLRVNHLPTMGKIDAHSIELCRRAADLDSVLSGLKNGLHLTIGVRDMLGREVIDATQASIGDTAEACVRRVIEHEYENVAERFGDPVDASGNRVELITLALGKFGGREPNYHSDLDVAFMFSVDGETQRRVGGRRSTTNNQHFYNQVARQTITRINQAGSHGRLFEMDCRLQPDDEGVLVTSVEEFFAAFLNQTAPIWKQMALCKARVITGNRIIRAEIGDRIEEAIASTNWSPEMSRSVREMRSRLETTASTENFKRGAGGTLDAEWVAQALTLKYAASDVSIIRQGTVESLSTLSEAGLLDQIQAETLIRGYRTLRYVEAHLCLMTSSARHELPETDDERENLAFLLGESDHKTIHKQCLEARAENRKVFDAVFGQLDAG